MMLVPPPVDSGCLVKTASCACLPNWLIAFAVALTSLGLSSANAAPPIDAAVQSPATDAETENENAGIEDATDQTGNSSDMDQAAINETVRRLVAEMNSPSFAARERAMTQLFDLGVPAIAPLRQRVRDGLDRERAERIDQVVQRLSDGDLASRIDQFLAGEAIELEGWSWTRAMMGDNRAVRNFFVELMKEFPEATPKLDGVTRDRGSALKLFREDIKKQLQFGAEMPSRASTVCLLLPIVDEGVPVDQELDEMVLSLVRRAEASNALGDKAFSESYKRLLGAWMRRSQTMSRERVFQLGLRLQLSVVIDLAAETLQLAADDHATEDQRRPSLITTALQVIAARGVPRELELVTPFQDDDRPAIRDTFYGGQRIRTEVGDAAAASIVRLLRKDFAEFGFGDARPDPDFGFALSEIGFPTGGEANRRAMKNHVRQLIAANEENGKPAGQNDSPGGIPHAPQ